MTSSKTSKLLKHLEAGASVSANQITKSFGLANPYEAIRTLRTRGVCVYTNKNSSGVTYRIGTPTRKMVRMANALFGAAAFTR